MQIGHRILTFDDVSSTNDLAKLEAERGAEEGLVVVAKSQSQGRGRRGRVWNSAPGLGLYLSVVLRPDSSDVAPVAILGGVAAAAMVNGFGIEGVSVKWPNDVLVNGRKIAGVLVEPRMGGKKMDFAILGIGVNVRHTETDWPPELKSIATSLLAEGHDTDCESVTRALLAKLNEHYARRDQLLEAWTRWSGSPRLPVLD